METWKKIDDDKLLLFWKKSEDDDCGEGPDVVKVSPGWYECNGTPICFCGRDMVYSHAEILSED